MIQGVGSVLGVRLAGLATRLGLMEGDGRGYGGGDDLSLFSSISSRFEGRANEKIRELLDSRW